MGLRTVGVRLTADVASYMSNMKRAGGATKEFTGDLNKAAKSGHLDTVADGAGVAGLALVGMAGYAIKSAAAFDKAMSGVRAATHASAGDMDMLRKAALQAGKDTSFSATEAADGITELSKAGVSTADVLGGGLKGALDLAAAGQLDVGEAAETAATAMTQFNLKGAQVGHIADLLAAGAGKAQGSVHDMGYALKAGGLVASQMGLSIEDTTGALAAFASAGLIGSDAGTSFKSMLQALQNPSAKSADQMQDLGIQVYDAQGKFVGLTNLAGQLQTKLQGLTQAQRDQAMAQIFGSDGIRAATVLYKQGASGIQDWIDKTNDAGYAAETARIQTDNLAGDIERLKGSMETLAIESGGGANGGLRVIAKSVNALVDEFGQLPAAISGSITVLAGVSGVALLAGAGWIKARRSSAAFRAELEAMGPNGVKAASGIQKVTSAAGKLSAAFAALEVAGAIIGHFQKDLNPQTEALAVGLQKYATGAELSGEASRVLGDNLKDLKVGFSFLADEDNSRRAAVKNMQQGLESLIPGLDGTNTSLTKTKERIDAVDATLAQLVGAGNLDQAKTDFDSLAKQLAVGGVSIEEFRKQFPQYAASLEAAKGATKSLTGALGKVPEATDGATTATKEYKSATDAAAQAARGQHDAMSQLSDFMKAEADPVFGLIEAQGDLAKAHKAATEATKKHGAGSREAKAADRDLALAAIELQGKVGALGQSFDGKLSPAMKATLRAGGLTEKQIKDVAKQFRGAKTDADKYAGKYEAKASAPGAKAAQTALENAYTAANHFAGPYVARLSVDGVTPVDAKLDALLVKQRALQTGLSVSAARGAVQKDLDRNRQRGYASGGWTGPGPAHEPAGVVHADEFVIRKDSRRKIEARAPGMLQEMNATGQVPGYAGGGRVWPFPTNVSKTKIPDLSAMLLAGGAFGHWPSSPGAQRGDSGVWRKILALVKASGIKYEFGNSYRPGDPLWHGSGRAIDFMGYNQDRLAQFFLARQGQVLELIHRSKSRDYGITRGHYAPMPHQWPLHRNHLHIAMKNGGTINEPVTGVGASGRTYSFGENYQPERVVPNWQGNTGGGGAGVTVVLQNHGVIGSQMELDNWLARGVDRLKSAGRV